MSSPLEQIATSLSNVKLSDSSSESKLASSSSLLTSSPSSLPNVSSSTTPSSYDWTKIYQQWNTTNDTDILSSSSSSSPSLLFPNTTTNPNDPNDPNDLLLPSSLLSSTSPLSMSCSHNHTAEQRIFDMNHKEKYTTCTYLKQLGNLYNNEGLYNYSIDRYYRGIIYYEYSFPDTPIEQEEMDTIYIQLLLNYSLSALRIHNYDKVINLTTQIINMDKYNLKAYYRRIIAYRCTSEYTKAMEDIVFVKTVIQQRLSAITNQVNDNTNITQYNFFHNLQTIINNEEKLLNYYQRYYYHQEKLLGKTIVNQGFLGGSNVDTTLPSIIHNVNDLSNKETNNSIMEINHSHNHDKTKERNQSNDDEIVDDNDELDTTNDNDNTLLYHYPQPSLTSQLLQL